MRVMAALSAVQYPSGTYNVDATCGPIQQACGRVTVNLPGAPSQPAWYLVTADQAFVVDASPAVMSGSFQSQIGTGDRVLRWVDPWFVPGKHNHTSAS